MPAFELVALIPRREAADPRLARALARLACLGLLLVLAWPAARGHSAWLGWLPLWLAAMPASALWALHRFPVPRPRAPDPRLAVPRRARRSRPQARRLRMPARAPLQGHRAA
jgi:hypothetical protein